jgi:hypothetical protein
MRNDGMNTASANPMPAPPQPLSERLLRLSESDLQSMGVPGSFHTGRSFDNAFKNGFKNIAQ